MLKIMLNEKNIEVISCFENKSYNEGKINESISLSVKGLESQGDFETLLGTQMALDLLDGDTVIFTISEKYTMTEIFRNIGNPIGGFSVSFQK